MPSKFIEKRRSYCTKYHAKNKDAINLKKRLRYHKFKDAINEKRRYRRKRLNRGLQRRSPVQGLSKEELLAYQREMRRIYMAARRAKAKNAKINDFTAKQWREMKAHYGYKCAYCDVKTVALTQDHITPISKGGNHTMSNIVPACQKCNSKKGARCAPKLIQPLLL